MGFVHVLERCRHHGVKNLLYTSNSSVYGGNRNLPFHEQQPVNHSVSLYAATKKGTYLWLIHTANCMDYRRWVCVFSWCMASGAGQTWRRCCLLRQSLAGEPIKVFNHGKMQRDFTYINDTVEGVMRCCDKPATPNPDFDPLQPDPATAAARIVCSTSAVVSPWNCCAP